MGFCCCTFHAGIRSPHRRNVLRARPGRPVEFLALDLACPGGLFLVQGGSDGARRRLAIWISNYFLTAEAAFTDFLFDLTLDDPAICHLAHRLFGKALGLFLHHARPPHGALAMPVTARHGAHRPGTRSAGRCGRERCSAVARPAHDDGRARGRAIPGEFTAFRMAAILR